MTIFDVMLSIFIFEVFLILIASLGGAFVLGVKKFIQIWKELGD